MAPEPFAPEVFTPEKPITVIEESTACESVAVAVTACNGEAEKALQISAVPGCAFVLSTRTQVSPAPDTVVTVVLGEETLSAEINASRSSLAEVVENTGVLTVVLAVFWSVDTVASIPMATCTAELKFAVAFAPLTVTGWLESVKTYPVLVGVTVY